MLYPKGAPVLMNSTVAAARARVRGPTLSEQRAEQQRKDLEATRLKMAARMRRLQPLCAVACAPMGSCRRMGAGSRRSSTARSR